MRTGGYLWGRERIRLGISISELSKRSGMNVGMLSYFENGRMIPTAEEFDRVMAVLRDAEDRQANAGSTAGENPG